MLTVDLWSLSSSSVFWAEDEVKRSIEPVGDDLENENALVPPVKVDDF